MYVFEEIEMSRSEDQGSKQGRKFQIVTCSYCGETFPVFLVSIAVQRCSACGQANVKVLGGKDASLYPLLIGQAPSKTSDPRHPLIYLKLAELTGLSYRKYLRTFDRINLLPTWPGSSGRGDKFPMEEARDRARALIPDLVGRRVVLVGRAVGSAFGCRDLLFLTWITKYGFKVAILPHPSGINVWWNKPSNRDAAIRFMRGLSCVGS